MTNDGEMMYGTHYPMAVDSDLFKRIELLLSHAWKNFSQLIHYKVYKLHGVKNFFQLSAFPTLLPSERL